MSCYRRIRQHLKNIPALSSLAGHCRFSFVAVNLLLRPFTLLGALLLKCATAHHQNDNFRAACATLGGIGPIAVIWPALLTEGSLTGNPKSG